MNLKLILLAVLPASIGASTSFYRPSQTAQILSRNELLNNKIATPLVTDACDESIAISLRGGEGSTNADLPKANELTGAAFFTILQVLLNKVFVSKGIKFPAMLGCTILVFTVLVLAEIVSPGLGQNGFELLTPGANVLTKWLPVMFVPGLAMLPLAPSIGTPLDALKVLSMVVIGFGFTMATTAYLVLAMRSAQGLVEEKVEEPAPPARRRNAPVAAAPAAPAKPFTEETLNFLIKSTVVAGAISVAATRKGNEYATPLRTIAMFSGTVLTYVFGARLPSGFTKVVHPLVTSTAGTLLLTKLDSLLTGSSFEDVLRTYKAGSLSPSKTGAGDLLLFLLGPAVGCLAVPMYSRKKIMADNLLVVIAACLCSSIGGLFGTAWYTRLLNIGSKSMIRLSLLSRNVTTGLAIVITQMLEGNIAIAASVVVLTGIFGATVGRGMLDMLGIEDPVSRGLGMGAAGQGLGVAAMMPEKDAFPFAAINMVLTAICATALVSIPSVKQMLVNIVSAGLE
ncbi:hypothetical protein ACHAWT_004124 [Skeletonema menzelii]|mmetsp:Transcript_677/g.1113  ORF Transcript_677/g.1113 Transcript_677/m.1113 type:complete len:511 (-) Transcript_677:120-1652(-)|eukprot:scaffold12_cov150-Skeletonema_menzelii.AAC.7